MNEIYFQHAPKHLQKTKNVNGTIIEFEYLKLLDEYDPKLSNSSFDWDFNRPIEELRYIGISLAETMVKEGGVGLAAIQAGIPLNIFAIGGGGYANVIVNPKILRADGEEVAIEGCLSSPGLFLKIKRANSIDVEYYDMNGNVQFRTFEGLTARIFLHEFDHLQGILFTTLVPKITLQREKEKRKTNIKKIKKAKEVQQRQQKLALLTKQVKEAQEASKPNNVISITGSSSVKPVVSGTIDLSTLK